MRNDLMLPIKLLMHSITKRTKAITAIINAATASVMLARKLGGNAIRKLPNHVSPRDRATRMITLLFFRKP